MRRTTHGWAAGILLAGGHAFVFVPAMGKASTDAWRERIPLDRRPFVAGGFAWSGWDYLGEPTPYYGAPSSYFGITDLAGFPKDRFYLYQSHWRPELPMAHILPHWNWPERVGQVTPVHVFTSGDRAELFLNGRSLGVREKAPFAHRLRFRLEGPGEIVATDNGDPTCMIPFPSPERPAFHGLCLVVIRGLPEQTGTLRLAVPRKLLAPKILTWTPPNAGSALVYWEAICNTSFRSAIPYGADRGSPEVME
jgi:hypothetical protein